MNNAASRGVPIKSGREENGANAMVEGGMMTKWKAMSSGVLMPHTG